MYQNWMVHDHLNFFFLSGGGVQCMHVGVNALINSFLLDINFSGSLCVKVHGNTHNGTTLGV